MGSCSILGGFGILYRSAGLSDWSEVHWTAEHGNSKYFRADYERDYRDTGVSGKLFAQDAFGLPVHPFFGNNRGKNERIKQGK